MKKILPIFCLLFLFTFQFVPFVNAQPSSTPQVSDFQVPDGTWVKDPDVTFAGKSAARAGSFLDWALEKHEWVSLGSTENNPLITFWKIIRNIVYAFFSIFVLITAFVIMITRGKSITVMRFIPRFIGIILLVTFSFALIQFIYQIFDIIQGFFLKNPDNPSKYISQANLLNIGFDYKDFIGYRLSGVANDESGGITLLLTKLTAITYYVMVGVLIIRKIILWFFIIISPIFPLLLLYRPIRNTGKLWIGEFFRWLLYGPLFAVLLAGVVSLWRTEIPLFSYNTDGTIKTTTERTKSLEAGRDTIYPTAVNILLGGPRQRITDKNSINLPETFALYVVSLIMLWVVIILPFILLKIFLDYMFSISIQDGSTIRQIMSMTTSFLKPPPPPVAPSSSPNGPTASTGMARALPFMKRFSISEGVGRTQTETIARQSTVRQTTAQSSHESSEITRLTNISVPTMQDIARFESSRLKTSVVDHQQVATMHESLERIADPARITAPAERAKYIQVRDKLVQESRQGNVFATTILNAANTVSKTSSHATRGMSEAQVMMSVMQQIAHPEAVPQINRAKYLQVKEKLSSEKQKGNELASMLMENMQKGMQAEDATKIKTKLEEEKQKGNVLAENILALATPEQVSPSGTPPSLPVVNRLQTVSLEDYEAVKKIWIDNYKNLDVPQTAEKQQTRRDWIQKDSANVTETINLLSSPQEEQRAEGMKAVSSVLPFLLIGGFSQTEIIAYLKAKQAAARDVLEDVQAKDEDEDSLLSAKRTTQEQEKSQEVAAEIPTTEPEKT